MRQMDAKNSCLNISWCHISQLSVIFKEKLLAKTISFNNNIVFAFFFSFINKFTIPILNHCYHKFLQSFSAHHHNYYCLVNSLVFVSYTPPPSQPLFSFLISTTSAHFHTLCAFLATVHHSRQLNELNTVHPTARSNFPTDDNDKK